MDKGETDGPRGMGVGNGLMERVRGGGNFCTFNII